MNMLEGAMVNQTLQHALRIVTWQHFILVHHVLRLLPKTHVIHHVTVRQKLLTRRHLAALFLTHLHNTDTELARQLLHNHRIHRHLSVLHFQHTLHQLQQYLLLLLHKTPLFLQQRLKPGIVTCHHRVDVVRHCVDEGDGQHVLRRLIHTTPHTLWHDSQTRDDVSPVGEREEERALLGAEEEAHSIPHATRGHSLGDQPLAHLERVERLLVGEEAEFVAARQHVVHLTVTHTHHTHQVQLQWRLLDALLLHRTVHHVHEVHVLTQVAHVHLREGTHSTPHTPHTHTPPVSTTAQQFTIHTTEPLQQPRHVVALQREHLAALRQREQVHHVDGEVTLKTHQLLFVAAKNLDDFLVGENGVQAPDGIVESDGVDDVVARVRANLGGNRGIGIMYGYRTDKAQVGPDRVLANVERKNRLGLQGGDQPHQSLLRVHNLVLRFVEGLRDDDSLRGFVFVLGIDNVFTSRKPTSHTINLVRIRTQITVQLVVLQIHSDLAGEVFQQKHARQRVIGYS